MMMEGLRDGRDVRGKGEKTPLSHSSNGKREESLVFYGGTEEGMWKTMFERKVWRDMCYFMNVVATYVYV